MPTQVSYPGVYIEEVPSGVRSISGVPTSIAAFVGRARYGPVNTAVLINGFAEFERRFGGLEFESTMSYAVRDFFANGGGQAVIVRVINGGAVANLNLPTGAAAPNDNLQLRAASPGAWGATLQGVVDHNVKDPTDTSLFNLYVNDGFGNVEQHLNVSITPAHPRFVGAVLERGSNLVRVLKTGTNFTVPNARPSATVGGPIQGSGGADGNALTATQLTGSPSAKTGIYALDGADSFNLLCIPPPTRDGDTPATTYQAALNYCVNRRALLIVDPLQAWSDNAATAVATVSSGVGALNLTGNAARNAAIYFPHILAPDPLRDNRIERFVPSGAVAGVMARTDGQRGVWKAPAGTDAALAGVAGLALNLNDLENGTLNQLGVNVLRSFPVTGRVVWGARTMRGADALGDEYRYVPVRRLALFIEESLYRGTQWVVFEPNDEPLWSQIRLNLGSFMNNLFRQGAFQGAAASEAYFVKCDSETTTQADINLGIVNIIVGFAPLKPAEFVIIRIQQIAGQVTA
jgi:uncharacterized protein